MPHKCTRCGKIFKEGASEILSGCPSCGWNKFLYVTGAETSESEAIDIEELISKVEVEEREKPKDVDSHKVESVKIVGPGSYELNIESLLDRPEIIMALKEEGTYMVHLPSIFESRSKKRKRKK
ncbi:MAG: Zn-ribbon domain-containing protein [Methanocellales archaeon]|nr:Zn-ribbon domain-containing protein [Methanocellales archaeon]